MLYDIQVVGNPDLDPVYWSNDTSPDPEVANVRPPTRISTLMLTQILGLTLSPRSFPTPRPTSGPDAGFQSRLTAGNSTGLCCHGVDIIRCTGCYFICTAWA